MEEQLDQQSPPGEAAYLRIIGAARAASFSGAAAASMRSSKTAGAVVHLGAVTSLKADRTAGSAVFL